MNYFSNLKIKISSAMKFPSCFSHVLLLVFSLAAPQILGAQTKTAASPATKPGVVKTSLTAQPGNGTTPVVQYYSDNDLLPASDDISRVDLEETKWKSVSEYADVLSAERVLIAQTIAAPDFDHHKLPTFQGYDRILIYMQQSLAGQMSIEQIGESSYQQVVKEAETDMALAGLDWLVIEAYYSTLLINLRSGN